MKLFWDVIESVIPLLCCILLPKALRVRKARASEVCTIYRPDVGSRLDGVLYTVFSIPRGCTSAVVHVVNDENTIQLRK